MPPRPETAAEEVHDDEEQQEEQPEGGERLDPARRRRRGRPHVVRRRRIRPSLRGAVAPSVIAAPVASRAFLQTQCIDDKQHVANRSYAPSVPKLWRESIDAHRRAVREATLDTAGRLVAAHGLRSVTMSRIAEETGIGRATLYKYFPDVETILAAWHERQVAGHLQQLAVLGDGAGDPTARLRAVLEAYALALHEGHGDDLAASLHRGEHVVRARRRLLCFIEELLIECAGAGVLRGDVPPGELAAFCLHSLAAARDVPSKAAARRLVAVALDGLASPG